MRIQKAAALLYASATCFVIAFQIALAAGAPWGEYAMGGLYPGQLPPPVRVAEVVQASILGWLAVIVFARAGVCFSRWSRLARWHIWIVVSISTLSLVMNLSSQSEKERNLWAPVALLLFISSALVAIKSKATPSAG